MKFLLVDSNSIMNRAFYGIRLLSTKSGQYTNAIYGFLNILSKLISDTEATAYAFAFDLKAPTFRHEQFEDYKAGRKSMPEELRGQFPLIKDIIRALGYQVVECEGFEADDIIGTLAYNCANSGIDNVIATGDRDSLQLVCPCTTVRLATTKMGKPHTEVYTVETVFEKYGVKPEQLKDVKALMGDSSDNIPGVAGIGEKTAFSLIQQFGSIDYIYENLESLDIKDGVRKKLEAGRNMCFLSYKLGEIECNAPIDKTLDNYLKTEGDPQQAAAIFKELELFKLMDKFGVDAAPAPTAGNEQLTLETAKTPTVQNALAKGPVQVGDLTLPALQEILNGEKDVFAVFATCEDVFEAVALNVGGGVLRVENGGENFENIVNLLVQNAGRLITAGGKEFYRAAIKLGLDANYLAYDIQLAAYLLNANAPEYDFERLINEYGSVPNLPEEHLENAVVKAAAAITEIYAAVAPEIERQGQYSLLKEIEIPLSKVLAEVETEGFMLDTAGLKDFGDMLQKDLIRLEESIYTHAGEQFNINSPKQMGEILFNKLMLPAKKKTKSGYSTNAEVLEGLKNEHPIIADILEYRKLMKLKSTYVDGLLKVVGKDGRVHSNFKQTETRTGRISSTEPNMQNIPVRTELGSNLRKFFHAKDGCKLLDADYSQIELRVLAHIANDEKMIEAFNTGADIHTQTASQVFGMPMDFVTPLMRSRAKAVNFGIVYGIGAFSLAQDIGVSNKEASEYIKSYLETYSGVKNYMDNVKKQAAVDGYVSTLFGRRRSLPELAASNKITKAFGERVAMNMPIQGTAADIIKIAMIKVYESFKAQNLKARLILQVHDELIVECPNDELDVAAEILENAMESAAALKVKLEAEVGMGKNWYEAK